MSETPDQNTTGVADTIRTAQQLDIERKAARLLLEPGVQTAIGDIGAQWVQSRQPGSELQALFEREFGQIACCSAINVFNADPVHPMVHAFCRFEHETDGLRVPGTKSGSPCPDYVYRFIPVDAENHYAVRGWWPTHGPAAFEFGVIDVKQVYQGTVSAHQLVLDSQGRFCITIDPEPANGRPNHIQTRPGACQVIVRDVLGDVARDRPCALEVERTGPGPARSVLAFDPVQRFRAELRKFIDDLEGALAFTVNGREINHFTSPAFNDDGTYLVTQAYCPGRYALRDGQALVFHLGLGNAAYGVIPVTNAWGGIGDFLSHTSTLGTGRALPNPDGSYSFVLSLEDPGVHNWIDPGGLHEGVIYARWAGFDPRLASRGRPFLSAQLVDLDRVRGVLSPGCPMISSTERSGQIALHRAAYLTAMG